MNVLLKIVQGPNAGAEIAVAEGMTLSIGKDDSCDILLADQSLLDVACELEVSSERVRLLLPGGVEERLEPFVVKFLGDVTAIAVGPETGIWNELVWPRREDNVDGGKSGDPDVVQSGIETVESSVATAAKKRKYRFGCGCLSVVIAVVSIVCFMCSDGRYVAAFAWDLAGSLISDAGGEELILSSRPSIHDVAEAHRLLCIETNGTFLLSGNFATRAERLSAIAAAYAAKPGVVLDLSDDESLRHAVAEVLELVDEGKLKINSATNRVVELAGFALNALSLRTTLEAIRADVPKVRNVECSRVVLGEYDRATVVGKPIVAADMKPISKKAKTVRSCTGKSRGGMPKMPIVGVTTIPYPCIVLNDGSRVTEGAEFEGFVIDKIGVDAIRVRGSDGIFEWRP